ncbi:T9SS type A sorting domain-containing protein [Rufibacter glacialis]|nr:T9SS type A sorting domain-containing protein [Rufibacter glacialis]
MRVSEVVTVSGGNWSAPVLGSANLKGGDVLYAVAIAPGGKTESPASAMVTVTTPSSAFSLGLTLNSPIKERATIITGTSATNGIVSLFIDGQRIAGTATVTGATSSAPVPWFIAISATNQANLAPGIEVSASLAASGCESQPTAAVLVSCVAPSTTPTFTPAAQTVCHNSQATLTVANTENGVIYQIYDGSTPSGPAMVGNGNTVILTSGPLTSATVLTMRAYQVGASACQATLSGSTSITISPAPSVFVATPASATVCQGSTATVTLSGSEEGASYQIQVLNATTGTYSNTGNAVVGTGKALSLTTGTLTASGTFKVIATRNGCSSDMGNTFTLTVPSNALAIVPSVQSVCAGSTASVVIQNSENGVVYQLQSVSGTVYTNTGASVTGNGGNITLTTATLSTAGANNFRVLASSMQCAPFPLTQQITVNVTSGTPTVFSLTPSTQTVCSGMAASFTLNGSQVGMTYQLLANEVLVPNSSVAGTGNPLTFSSGALTTGGTYTVRASNACGNTVPMSGSSAVTVTPVATAFALTPTTQMICNNSGATFILAGSESSVTYQLQVYNPTTGAFVNYGAAIIGTGSALTLRTNALTSSANFKVVATRSGSTCSVEMSNTVFVSVPTNNLTVSAITPAVCTGSTAQVRVNASEVDVFYQLFVNGVANGTAVEGTGGDITLVSSVISASTTFTVQATTASCSAFTIGNPVTVAVSTPTVQSSELTTLPSICSGSTSSIRLGSSQPGITYQMYNGTSPTGFGVTGTGQAITLTSDALSSNADLRIFAISSGCANTAMGSAHAITVNALPTQYTFTPTKKVTSSGGTITIEMPASQNGVDYQIYDGNMPSGSRVQGTGGAITLTSGPLSKTTTLTVQAIGTGGCGNTTMNGYSMATVESTTLPVTLLSFSGFEATAGAVQLTWATAVEKDNDFFLVERSQDGKAFVAVGKIKGHGTSNELHRYLFTDAAAPAGTNYYRLKQVDFNGQFEYSKVIALKAKGNSKAVQAVVTPNPFQQELGVAFTSTAYKTVQVQLFDLNQKLIYQETAEIAAGKMIWKKDFSKIANGLYLLRITSESVSEVKRVVKKD